MKRDKRLLLWILEEIENATQEKPFNAYCSALADQISSSLHQSYDHYTISAHVVMMFGSGLVVPEVAQCDQASEATSNPPPQIHHPMIEKDPDMDPLKDWSRVHLLTLEGYDYLDRLREELKNS
jgi:hypothetical protein